MSERETGRLRVLEQVLAGRLTQRQAAEILELTPRQVRRLQGRYAIQGAAALVHGLRGRASNRGLAAPVVQQATVLLAEHYADFGPTLAAEKLAERHGVELSVETVRKLMMHAGLWRPKRVRNKPIHPLRARRARRGELIQIDGSLHDWFEGRAPRCTLLVFIDDATSELMALRLVHAETTMHYMRVLHEYILAHGLPACLYSDRHSIFRTSKPGADEPPPTQFARALATLGIEGIQASSAQAKGRVERANQTLQDRLVKEMRLAGLADIESANAWLPGFIQAYNHRFAVPARSPDDAHVRYRGEPQTLGRILAYHDQRRLSPTLSCQYRNQLIQVHAPGQQRILAGAQVQIVVQLDASLLVLHQGKPLSYHVCDRPVRSAPAVNTKTLDQRVDQVLSQRPKPAKPSALHPWKRWVGNIPNPNLHQPASSP